MSSELTGYDVGRAKRKENRAMKIREAVLMAYENRPRWNGPRRPSRLFGQNTRHRIGIPL